MGRADLIGNGKHHLVPFGECIPAGFRWCTEMMKIPLGDFARGPLVAPWARTLGGVDLSRGMLDRAQTKGVYSDLFKAT